MHQYFIHNKIFQICSLVIDMLVADLVLSWRFITQALSYRHQQSGVNKCQDTQHWLFGTKVSNLYLFYYFVLRFTITGWLTMEYLLQRTIDMLQLTVLSQPQSVLFSLMMTRPNLQIFTYHVQFSIFAKFCKIIQELSVLWTEFSFWGNCLDFNSIPGRTNLKRGIYIL